MSGIRWTLEAENWLRDIHDYISRDNPSVADRVINGIFAKVELLFPFPQIGHVYRKDESGTIRILLYGHYRIAYLLKPNDDIDILGVFHGAMELERYLPRSDEDKNE